jgi:hypothetical protein
VETRNGPKCFNVSRLIKSIARHQLLTAIPLQDRLSETTLFEMRMILRTSALQPRAGPPRRRERQRYCQAAAIVCNSVPPCCRRQHQRAKPRRVAARRWLDRRRDGRKPYRRSAAPKYRAWPRTGLRVSAGWISLSRWRKDRVVVLLAGNVPFREPFWLPVAQSGGSGPAELGALAQHNKRQMYNRSFRATSVILRKS